MGFDIPEPFCWDESFKVFYKKLDEQHKGLFQGILECAEGRSDSGALSSLYVARKMHFETEEQMMSTKTYADLAPYKKAHNDFSAKLSLLSCRLGDAAILYAKDWLVNHITGTDFKYKDQL